MHCVPVMCCDYLLPSFLAYYMIINAIVVKAFSGTQLNMA